MDNNREVIYDENVNYSELDQHEYKDSPGFIFYNCPVCGEEYLATFITEVDGQVMCIDCEIEEE